MMAPVDGTVDGTPVLCSVRMSSLFRELSFTAILPFFSRWCAVSM